VTFSIGSDDATLRALPEEDVAHAFEAQPGARIIEGATYSSAIPAATKMVHQPPPPIPSILLLTQADLSIERKRRSLLRARQAPHVLLSNVANRRLVQHDNPMHEGEDPTREDEKLTEEDEHVVREEGADETQLSATSHQEEPNP
jgi:hypothetical protein